MRLELKIRELEMPCEDSLIKLNAFLVDFYRKNIISPEQLKYRYDVFYDFKRKFLSKFPSKFANKFSEKISTEKI
jgi:hypothetical protein